MNLSIIVPVYNEEETIIPILQKLSSLSILNVQIEIIVVNDGSKDNTQIEIEKIKKKIKNLRVFVHPRNKGKGAAIKTGIKEATGEYILVQDADLEYDPADIKILLKPVMTRKATVVYGTRLKRLPNFYRDERTPTFFLHYLGNRMLSLTTSLLFGQWITDMETGYKLIPRKLITSIPLHAKSFDFEPEITAKILKRGYAITEIPISTNPRDHAQGKKLVAIKDGPIAFWTLLKYRFVD